MASDSARTRTRPSDAADEERLGLAPPTPESAPTGDSGVPLSPEAHLGIERRLTARPPGRGYAASRAALLLLVQQTEGNRAVQRLLRRAGATAGMPNPGRHIARPPTNVFDRVVPATLEPAKQPAFDEAPGETEAEDARAV